MMNETTLQGVLDRLEITDVVNRVATYADLRDWARVRDCFTDEIDIDYTSLNGGSPAHLSADILVEQWRAGLSGLQATQHMISNHLITVTGNEATCLAYVQAQHYLPNDTGEPTWTLGGRYTYLLIRTAQGWKIRSSTLTVLWAKGNQHVMTLAPQQVTPTQQG